MLCDICHKRVAKIFYTEIKNGEKKEQFLCEECAANHSSFQTDGNFLSSILGNIYGANESLYKSKKILPSCDICKTTYEEVLHYGKFGCASCYEAFYTMTERSLKQIQGADHHVGKCPDGRKTKQKGLTREITEIDKLSILLGEAVEKEEFEQAAVLRDKIRMLKGEQTCLGGMNKEENSPMS